MSNNWEVGMPEGVPTGRRPAWLRRLFPDRQQPETTVEIAQDDLVAAVVYCATCGGKLGFVVRHKPQTSVPRAWADRPDEWPGLNTPDDYVGGEALCENDGTVTGFCAQCEAFPEAPLRLFSNVLDAAVKASVRRLGCLLTPGGELLPR